MQNRFAQLSDRMRLSSSYWPLATLLEFCTSSGFMSLSLAGAEIGDTHPVGG